MSVDRRLREGFQRSAPAIEPEIQPALDRTLARSRRIRAIRAISVTATVAMVAVVVAVLGPAALDMLRGQREQPAVPPAPSSILGNYSVDLTASTDPALTDGNLQGRWRFDLRGDGLVIVQVPTTATVLSGRVTYQYTVDGTSFATNLFANDLCAGQPSGTYSWRRVGSELEFTLVDDPCAVRAAILSVPWSGR